MARKLSAGALAVREAGGITLAKFREVRQSPGYLRLAEKYAAFNQQTLESTTRSTSRFTRDYLRAHFKDGVWRRHRSTSRRGPTHWLLVHAGERDPNAEYEVGRTPKKK